MVPDSGRMSRRALMTKFGDMLRAAVPLTAIILQACVVGPKYHAPQTQAPAAFKEEQPPPNVPGVVWTNAEPQEGALRGKWWTIYNEPELNALEDRLNVSDQNIVAAFQNFEAARAVVRQAQAAYYPTVTFGPQYTHSGTAGSSAGTASAISTAGGNGSGTSATTVSGLAGGRETNAYSLPFDVSWEPDIWGKVRNTVRGDKAAAQASAADLANERLSEEASLAVDYFELRGQDAQIELYRRTIAAYVKSLDLTRVLLKTGIDDGQSYAQAELNLTNAQASATNLGIARAQYEHAIALLVGEPASSFSLPERPLTTPAPVIAAGLPSSLLERRPDIAAAERTLAQANAQIGVQVAALYPSLSLTGEGGVESSDLSSLLSAPSRFFTIGLGAVQTIFDAGLHRAEIAQAKAQYQADLATYRNTVLTAFQQTEDGLATDRLLAIQLRQQDAAVAAATRYYDLAQSRFNTGVDTYLNVFTAETALLSDQQAAIMLRVQQMTNGVQLIKDLGGGWHAPGTDATSPRSAH